MNRNRKESTMIIVAIGTRINNIAEAVIILREFIPSVDREKNPRRVILEVVSEKGCRRAIVVVHPGDKTICEARINLHELRLGDEIMKQLTSFLVG